MSIPNETANGSAPVHAPFQGSGQNGRRRTDRPADAEDTVGQVLFAPQPCLLSYRSASMACFTESSRGEVARDPVIIAVGPAMEEFERRKWGALVDLLGDLLDGRIELTEACRAVVSSSYGLEPENALFNPFRGFDSESDAFPLGQARTLWAPNSLKEMDTQREHTEAYYRDWVLEAAKQLRSYARDKCL